MAMRHAYSGLLAALIALPMYYMFFEIFNKGFDASPFIVAVIIGVITFVLTILIASLVSRSKQKA